MKIIQLNIWHGKLGDSAIQFLNDEQPDIVCLQEASQIQGPTYGMVVSLDIIQRQADLAYAVFAPTFSHQLMGQKCTFGNAILSKFPLDRQETVFTSEAYRDEFDASQNDHNIRNLQIVNARLPNGKQLTIANHHGYNTQDPSGNEQTLEATKKLAVHLAAYPKLPLILCADLNISPDSPAMQPLNNLALTNLTVKHGIKKTLSSVHKLDLNIACDYIFVSPDIKVRRFSTSDAIVSDHKPLILEFDI